MKWYALRTRSRHENKVKVFLEQNNCEVFLPLIEVWSKRKDRKKKIYIPLFPGYLFVFCEMTVEERIAILQIPGVVDTVGNAENRAVSIPVDQIESVKKIVNSGAIARPHPYLNEGDKVVVTHGQLSGAVGYYVKTDAEKGVLVISLDMLGRSVEVDIDVNLVNKF